MQLSRSNNIRRRRRRRRRVKIQSQKTMGGSNFKLDRVRPALTQVGLSVSSAFYAWLWILIHVHLFFQETSQKESLLLKWKALLLTSSLQYQTLVIHLYPIVGKILSFRSISFPTESSKFQSSTFKPNITIRCISSIYCSIDFQSLPLFGIWFCHSFLVGSFFLEPCMKCGPLDEQDRLQWIH